MKKKIILIAAGACALAACGGQKPNDPPKARTSAGAKAKPASAKRINAPVEDAMMSIPPEMRADYQKAFACEVKRNKDKKDAKAIDVTPDYVRGLTARLKADPSLARC